jgi:glycosyltransferase involved in cell wall biosynthesis
VRVALLSTDLQPGGTPLRVARLARGLHDAGVQVRVGCLSGRGPVSADLERAGLETFSCDARGPGDLGALWRLRGHLKQRRPDLVHSFLTHANVAARLAGKSLGIPVVCSTATIEVERPWHRWAELLTAPLEAGHIVNSHALADHVVDQFALPRERITVVPPLVGAVQRVQRSVAREKLDLPEAAFVIVCVARFDAVKRLEIAIRCGELLAPHNVHVVLAGDGPDRGPLELIAAQSSARHSIHLLGWQNDPSFVLSAADLLLLCSLTEGMPNAVLEAMSAGVPVVASDLPTLRELAGPDERIKLAAGDARDFASAIRELIEDPGQRAELAARAQRWAVRNLSPTASVAATIAAYEAALGGAER